ncbi:uncharacterized protein LOC134819400 isoform X2 [Bolinopsis microptera]|uniref:uncharacterized protein LOC134819400 isoform X2 n=1 Tax=Bolinopsis microptera TaxID=2820187 RepID=UPI003078AE68
MVKCPADGMTIKSRDSNNQRIAALEEKVAEQSKTIAALQRQLQSLSAILASAAQCIAEPILVEEVTTTVATEETNGIQTTDRLERQEELVEEEVAPVISPVKKETPPPVQYNYKNLLQEHVVKQGWTLPTYQTSKCAGGFSSIITVNENSYTSKTMKSKVLAEKSAACVLLQALNVIDENGVPVADGDPKRNAGVSKYSWCKNQLQEYFAKCGLKYPSYTITPVGGKGFTAEVSHEKFPEKVLGPLACSKRIAEQMVAHKAISVWKIIEDSSDS